ncbi:MAG: phosphodiester glycosidase family protein, partial [Deltaproteobacteria bacterium]|nr:phosphodiester glycosidase family protein [Deltaproteobacteria bacterium]
RIDPEFWSFRVFFDREPKTIKEWQQRTRAAVTCNGGFYQENFLPAGRILVNGTFWGPLKNRHMKGMFLAEPKKGFEHLPKATLIDLKGSDREERISSYEQGIQSFPILLDPAGQVRVNPSSFQANRTVLAQDRSGNIFILITEKPFFTLYDFGQYLKGLPFGFQFILNLDGGLRTQLAIQVKAFNYLFTGQGERREPSRFFSPEPVKLPSVIGVFPRGQH